MQTNRKNRSRSYRGHANSSGTAQCCLAQDFGDERVLANSFANYIELCDRPSVDSREMSEGVVLDYDADGRLVGIDVDNAGNKIELQRILLSKLPGKVETESAA